MLRAMIVEVNVKNVEDHLRTAHVRKFFGALAQHSTTTAQNLVQLAELGGP
jgi:hypothetical protein